MVSSRWQGSKDLNYGGDLSTAAEKSEAESQLDNSISMVKQIWKHIVK